MQEQQSTERAGLDSERTAPGNDVPDGLAITLTDFIDEIHRAAFRRALAGRNSSRLQLVAQELGRHVKS